MSWDEQIRTPSGKTYAARELLAWSNHYDNRIPVIEAKLDALAGKLSDDEANIIAAIRAEATEQVDVQALAAALGPMLARMPSDQVAELVDAINDENDRRERARANQEV